jgi:hypothetical protein
MPITIFKKEGNTYKNSTEKFGLTQTNGWWNSIQLADIDKDGDLDIIGGNFGLNSRHKASVDKPIVLFSKDFDNNGSLDPIMAYTNNGELVPYVQRDLLAKQIPSIKKKFPRFKAYSLATMKGLFGSDLDNAEKLKVTCLSSSIFINNNGKFIRKDLPIEAQFSPIKCLLVDDYNKDGNLDILISGNDLSYEPETGVLDAGTGLILLGNGKGDFKKLLSKDSGLWLNKEARDMVIIKTGVANSLICTNNNDRVQVFKYK